MNLTFTGIGFSANDGSDVYSFFDKETDIRYDFCMESETNELRYIFKVQRGKVLEEMPDSKENREFFLRTMKKERLRMLFEGIQIKGLFS